LLSADSPFDRWFYGGDATAVSPQVKRGFALFNEAGCAGCHRYSNAFALFSDDGLYRTGVEFESRAREAQPPQRIQLAPGTIVPLEAAIRAPSRNDEGRAEVTGAPEDRWRYRTPSLRNVAITHPYMHDGSLATLEAVIDFYDRGAGADPGRDSRLRPLGLTDDQKSALLAFLRALTGSNVDALAADARSAPIGDPAGEVSSGVGGRGPHTGG
jgi:cytochrome c peroxidase